METTIERWVADGYGWPLWMVRLLVDLAVLESRATLVHAFDAANGRLAANQAPTTWKVRNPGGLQ